MSMKNSLIKDLENNLPRRNILSSREECYAYSVDASNPKGDSSIADAVVFVENVEQVQKIVKIANEHKIPIICRGAGTNVVGACATPCGGIVLNFSRMNHILSLNSQNMTIKVEPGVIVEDIRKAAQEQGLYYPPAPSNMKVSTIGGSIAQNSAGAESFKYGTTKDYVLDLTVVMADGQILKTGSNTIKNAAGYNLTSLFTGSEGTLGIIVDATLKLIPQPEVKKVLMAYFDTTENSIMAVNSIIEKKIRPSTIDFMDKNALQTVERFYPANLRIDKECALIIEIDGFECDIEYQKDNIINIMKEHNATDIQYSSNEDEFNRIWMARRSSMGACAMLKPNVTTDDVIVPRENLSKLVKRIQCICEKYNLTPCLVGHVGDGSIHPQIPIDYKDETEYKNYKLAKSEIYKLTAELGGTISGEHGIGSAKKEYLPGVINAAALNYMRTIKQTFDPNNILNPYKIF